MNTDPWLMDLMDALRKQPTRSQLVAIIDRLEDHYDAFSGPGQEMVDSLLVQARRRLAELTPPPEA